MQDNQSNDNEMGRQKATLNKIMSQELLLKKEILKEPIKQDKRGKM